MNNNEQLTPATTSPLASQISTANQTSESALMQEDGADLLLDEFLLTALRSVKDRLALLKIEQEIERLVRDGSQSHVTFPPMSSYHRLMVHKIAHHWGLAHLTGVTQGPAPAKYVRVERGSAPTAPIFSLRELCESSPDTSTVTGVNSPPAPTPVAPVTASVKVSPGPVKLLLRRNDAPKNSHHAKSTLPNQANATRDQPSEPTNQSSPSLEEREAAYARARARIFSEQQANAADSAANNSTASPHNDEDWYDPNDLPNLEEDEEEYRRDHNARFTVSHVARPALVEQLDRLQLTDASRVTSVNNRPAPATRATDQPAQDQITKLGHILEVTGLTDTTSAPYLETVAALKDVATLKQLPNKEGQPKVMAIFGSAAQAQEVMTSFNGRNNSVQLKTLTARVTPVNVSFNSQAPNKSVAHNRVTAVNPRPAPPSGPVYPPYYYPNPTVTPVTQPYPSNVNPYQHAPYPFVMTPPMTGVNYHPAMPPYPPNTPYYYPSPPYPAYYHTPNPNPNPNSTPNPRK